MNAGAKFRYRNLFPFIRVFRLCRAGLMAFIALMIGLGTEIFPETALAQVIVGGPGLPGVEVNLGVLDTLHKRNLKQKVQVPSARLPGLKVPGAGLPGPVKLRPPGMSATLATALQPEPFFKTLLLQKSPTVTPVLPTLRATDALPPPVPPPVPHPEPARLPTPAPGPVSAPEIVGPPPAPARTEVPTPAAPVIADSGLGPAVALVPQVVAAAPPPKIVQVPQAPGPETATLGLNPAPDGLFLKGGELSRIQFSGADTLLPSEAEVVLKEIAALLAGTDRRIQLNAYAGGTEETIGIARRLSLSRALTVRSFLIDAGVRSTFIDVRALGVPEDDHPPERVDILLLAP